MRNDTQSTTTTIRNGAITTDYEPLFLGLTIADMHVRRAIQQAEQSGFAQNNPLAGLFITSEHANQLINKPFGISFGKSLGVNGNRAESSEADSAHWEAAFEKSRQSWCSQLTVAPHSPPAQLLKRFELTQIEAEMLLISFLPEFNPTYGRLFAYLQDDMTRKRPSVNLLLDLLANDLPHKLQLRQLLRQNGRLAHHHLLNLTPPDGQPTAPFLEQAVMVSFSVAHFLLGENQIEMGELQQCLPTTLKRVDSETFRQLQQMCQNNAPLITLIGNYGSGRLEAAQQIAARHGGWLLSIDLAFLAGNPNNFQERLANLLRDGRLNAATLYLRNWQVLLQDNHLPQAIWKLFQTYPHPIVVSSNQPWQPCGHINSRSIHHVQLPTANFSARKHLWQKYVEAESVSTARLANLFRFTPGQVEDAVATAQNIAISKQEPLHEAHYLAAARLHSNQRLNTLATHISPRHGWNEIVLPPDTLAQLHELVQRVQQQPTVYGRWQFNQKLSYGRGIAALFVGESGTGKTMAADIIAGELGLDLYKIDLSAVVSKYIGETEKNLECIFAEAETSNAILFFDEADAIFGKRGEVKDSHDRYANLEVSYLLQRMERFDGISILASNLHANIDEAFTRRLSFIVEFPFPAKAEREAIWRVSIPPAAPKEPNIDFNRLATNFELAGGSIKNIVLGAAFLAANDGCPISMKQLLHATKREYQKLGRLIEKSLFV